MIQRRIASIKGIVIRKVPRILGIASGDANGDCIGGCKYLYRLGITSKLLLSEGLSEGGEAALAVGVN